MTTTEGGAELNVFLMNTTIIIIVIYVGQNKDGNAFTQRRARSKMCLYSQELNIKKAGNLEAQLCFSFQKKAVYTVPL